MCDIMFCLISGFVGGTMMIIVIIKIVIINIIMIMMIVKMSARPGGLPERAAAVGVHGASANGPRR